MLVAYQVCIRFCDSHKARMSIFESLSRKWSHKSQLRGSLGTCRELWLTTFGCMQQGVIWRRAASLEVVQKTCKRRTLLRIIKSGKPFPFFNGQSNKTFGLFLFYWTGHLSSIFQLLRVQNNPKKGRHFHHVIHFHLVNARLDQPEHFSVLLWLVVWMSANWWLSGNLKRSRSSWVTCDPGYRISK